MSVDPPVSSHIEIVGQEEIVDRIRNRMESDSAQTVIDL